MKGNQEDFNHLARRQEFVRSKFNLGLMHQKLENYNYAFNYYKLAADKGYAPAQNNLAYMYNKVIGVSKDYAQALF